MVYCWSPACVERMSFVSLIHLLLLWCVYMPYTAAILYSAHFRPYVKLLLSTCYDLSVPLYSVVNEGLNLLIRKEL